MDKSNLENISADAVEQMVEQVKPYLTPIYRILSDDDGEHLGSGSYVEFNEDKFIITNEHVIRHRKNNPLAHKFHDSKFILEIDTQPNFEPKPVDVSVNQINEETWNQCTHRAKAIPFNRFAQKHAPFKNELFFISGYSDEGSTFVRMFDTLFSKVTSLLVQECPFPKTEKDANPFFHFSLPYNPELLKGPDGEVSLPNPHGLSGTLVWDTKLIKCYCSGKKWNPKMAEVTGIVWGWPSSAACLLATKVEHLKLFSLMNK